MHTTIPNSKPSVSIHAGKRLKLAIGFMALLLVTGCQTMPKAEEFFAVTEQTARDRALQTRLFETTDEKELLSASAAVLQDLGFQLEESVTDVGLLCATKERGAREYGQEIFQAVILVLGCFGGEVALMPVDLHQQINATLVTCRSETDPSMFSVRIQFYRKVWKGDGHSGDSYIQPGGLRMEMNGHEEIYRQFFAKLSKSLFLEAQQI